MIWSIQNIKIVGVLLDSKLYQALALIEITVLIPAVLSCTIDFSVSRYTHNIPALLCISYSFHSLCYSSCWFCSISTYFSFIIVLMLYLCLFYFFLDIFPLHLSAFYIFFFIFHVHRLCEILKASR